MSVPIKPTRLPVRRCLFGRPSEDSGRNCQITAAYEKHIEDKIQKWGYDFIADRPLANSDIEYEPIRMKEVPAFYHPRHVKTHLTRSDVDPAVPSTSQIAPVRFPFTRAAKRKLAGDTDTAEAAPLRKQASITNFVKVSRRRSNKIPPGEVLSTPAKASIDQEVESSPFRYVSAEAEKRARFPSTSSSPSSSPRKSPRKRLASFSPIKSPKKTPQKRAVISSSGKLRPRFIGPLTRLRLEKTQGGPQ